ncbi:MAG: hypothetical protein EXS49_02545 [Candidatus Pacebacteria bacterium]|nr:hypothetical protein [Candidatus Paceibacterota bacterium]
MLNNKKGQSIIELLVASSAIIAAVLGIVTLLNKSLGFNRINGDTYTATFLSAEGVEIIKNFFDRQYIIEKDSGSASFYGWGAGRIEAGIYEVGFSDNVLRKLSCVLAGDPNKKNVYDLLFGCAEARNITYSDIDRYSYNPAGSRTKFKRLIIIDDPHSSAVPDLDLEYRVTSAVGWESKGGKFSLFVQDFFLPWRTP